MDWCTSPDRYRKEGDSKTNNEHGCTNEYAPKMDDGKDAVQEQYPETSISQPPVEGRHMAKQRRHTYTENLTVIMAIMNVSEKAYRTLKTAKMVEAGRISICSPKPMWIAVVSGQRKPDGRKLP